MLNAESLRGLIFIQYNLKESPKEFLVQISIPFWRAIYDHWKILIYRDMWVRTQKGRWLENWRQTVNCTFCIFRFHRANWHSSPTLT